MSKILIKGYYGFGNLGDDILMKVSYEWIKSKFPDSSIVIFSNNKHNLTNRNYIDFILGAEVPLIDWTSHETFDFQINGGGGIHFDFNKGPKPYYLINKIIQVLGIDIIYKADAIIRFLTLKPKHLKYGKRVGIGLGVGPLNSSAKSFFRKVAELGSYDQAYVRDHFSFSLLKKLKFKGKLIQSTDLSFLTALWTSHEVIDKIQKSKNKIGIILKGNSEDIQIHYKKLANELVKKNYEVEFFAFDEVYDMDYINRMLPEYEVNIWLPSINNFDEYLSQFWTCSVCITDRAHGALLGAIGSVIPIVICTSQKSDQVVDMLNLDTVLNHFRYKKLYTIEDVTRIISDQKLLRKKIKQVVDLKKKLINENINSLMSI